MIGPKSSHNAYKDTGQTSDELKVIFTEEGNYLLTALSENGLKYGKAG